MRYLSVCSGIEAATVAWHPLGWEPVAFAEVSPFPCAVLQHHYPSIPNIGDMALIDGSAYLGIDVLVGGTPCQSFSVAGLRRGLSDDRGNLALKFVELADAIQPSFTLWENVPGVLSSKDNAFGCFLGGLCGLDGSVFPPGGGRWSSTGCVFGSKRAIAWRILDAQYFGVPQRRRRLFVVACPRNGADPTEIFFEFDGVRRDTPPGRKKGEDIAGTFTSGAYAGGAGGRPEGAAMNHFVPEIRRCSHFEGGPHPALSQSSNGGGIGMSDQELFSQGGSGLIVPEIAGTMKSMGGKSGGWNSNVEMAAGGYMLPYVPKIVSQAMSCKWSKGTSGPAGDEHHNLIGSGGTEMRVRRLTPRECERLQGFPDGYTDVPYRKKSAADSPRYKALGNSMAVPVMRWIGERIEAVKRGLALCK